jgi:nitroreductase
MEPLTPTPDDTGASLSSQELPDDTVGLIEGLVSTRAIRRYTDEPVSDAALRTIMFAASRAPNGSNRQAFRFIVLRDSPTAKDAKRLIGQAAQRVWDRKERTDKYTEGSGVEEASPKARMARTMREYVSNFERVPVLMLPCFVRYREPKLTEGASIYPACQNALLAARALGLGGVLTAFHKSVEEDLRDLLQIPEDSVIAATLTFGHPRGNHGPVRRLPLQHFVYEDGWGQSPAWAVDPPGTRHTAAGPPPPD